jgi:hypothetical protein
VKNVFYETNPRDYLTAVYRFDRKGDNQVPLQLRDSTLRLDPMFARVLKGCVTNLETAVETHDSHNP